MLAATGTWRAHGERQSFAAATASETTASPTPDGTGLAGGPPPAGDGPVAYATWLATALMTWDTRQTTSPDAHAAAVVQTGDPPDGEAAGFAADVAALLPTPAQWTALAQLDVTQQLTVQRAWIPQQWRTAAAADSGDLPAGTTAVNIQATRLRTGSWGGQPETSQTPVVMTVFVTCPPGGERCQGLRLSAPGRALQ